MRLSAVGGRYFVAIAREIRNAANCEGVEAPWRQLEMRPDRLCEDGAWGRRGDADEVGCCARGIERLNAGG